MDQISSAIDKCFSSLITDTDVKNVNDRKKEFNKFYNHGTKLPSIYDNVWGPSAARLVVCYMCGGARGARGLVFTRV